MDATATLDSPLTDDRLLDVDAVSEITSYRPRTIRRLVKAQKFLRPRQIGPGKLVWLKSELMAYLRGLPQR